MTQVIDCAGDPREQGAEQGAACVQAVQERLRREGLKTGKLPFASLRPLASGPVLGRGEGREIIRHYTHLAERMAGLARSTKTPFESLMQLFLRATAGEMGSRDLTAAALGAAVPAAAQSAVVLRTLPTSSPASGDAWLVRRSRPEVGFASVEVTLPWLVSAVAGINEAGVTAVYVPPVAWPGRPRLAGPAPSPILLVQECLQRFESLDACIDWCTNRDTSGAAELMLSDHSGEVAVVSVLGDKCSVLRRAAEPVVVGVEAELCGELEKNFSDASLVRLPDPLTSGDRAGEGSPEPLTVWIDVAARRLQLVASATPPPADQEPYFPA